MPLYPAASDPPVRRWNATQAPLLVGRATLICPLQGYQDDVLDRIVQYFDDVYEQLADLTTQISHIRKHIDGPVSKQSGGA